jgi:hypothetical protein
MQYDSAARCAHRSERIDREDRIRSEDTTCAEHDEGRAAQRSAPLGLHAIRRLRNDDEHAVESLERAFQQLGERIAE